MDQPPLLRSLSALVGDWTTEATHPALPGAVIGGRANATWLEGERFLLLRTQADHPDFPDALWVLGETGDGPVSHYFDSRGIHRTYRLAIDDRVWRLRHDSADFPQRFTGSIDENGDRIIGVWELSSDGSQWERDLEVTFERRRV